MTIGYFLLEPHSAVKDDNHFGAAVDLWKNYLADEMKVDISFSGPMPFPRLISETVSGRINAILLIARTDKRFKILDYPQIPFWNMTSSIAFMRDNRIKKLKDMDELNGLTLGFFAGGYIHPKLRQVRLIWSNTYNPDWIKVNLKILKFGRIDGIYNPDMVSLKYYVNNNSMEKLVRIVKIPDAKTPLYSVFSMKDEGYFKKKYEKALPSVLKRISYKDLIKKYISE